MRLSVRWSWALALAIALVAAGSVASAQHMNRGTGEPNMAKAQGGEKPMMNRFGLTEDQRESIAKIREDTEAARVPLMKECMELRLQLQAELMKDQPDQATVHSLAERLGELRTQMQLQNLDQRMAIRNVLTAEQRDKMMMHRHWMRMNDRRHEAMGMRGGRRMMMRREMKMEREDDGGCCMMKDGRCMMMPGQGQGTPGCQGMMPPKEHERGWRRMGNMRDGRWDRGAGMMRSEMVDPRPALRP